MQTPKTRYLVGVALFMIVAIYSLVEALIRKDNQFATMIAVMLGYFVFMIMDRIETMASIEKLDAAIKIIGDSLNLLKAELLSRNDKDTSVIRRMTAAEAFEYSIAKVRSSRKMYNTSFCSYKAISGGPYYEQWLKAIVDSVTENDCVVHEAISSHERIEALKKIYNELGKPIKGSYVAYDLSILPEQTKTAPFVEFNVFENHDGTHEVIFGWTVSNHEFAGTDCFVTNSDEVAKYFVCLFRRFQQLAKVEYLNK